MKKIGKTPSKVLSLVLAISMILSCFPFVGAAALDSYPSLSENITSLETVFLNESGEEVYEVTAGKVKAVSYVESKVSMNVIVSIAVYDQNTLVDISSVSDKLTIGGNVLSTNYVTTTATQTVRAFVWDSNINPLCVDSLHGSVGKRTITSATITVGSTTYQANVDRVNKEISVMVPVKYASYQDTANRDTVYNAIYENLKNATVSVTGNYASISPAASGTYDLLNTNPEITLTDAGGNKTVYTVKATVGEWGRYYDAEGATLDNGQNSWNKNLRFGMPITLNSEQGNGVWFATANSFYVKDGDSYVSNGQNKLSIETEGSNDYIHIDKDSTDRSMTFYSTGVLSKNEAYEAEFKLRINSLTGDNASKNFMNIWSSNTDQILLTRVGASEGKYRIAHSRIGATSDMIEYVPGIELSLGEWNTFKYVYKANSIPVAGTEFNDYEMQLYINGKLVDVFCHGVTSNPQNAGRLLYIGDDVASYPQIAFNPYLKTVIDMDIDDVFVKASSSSRSFDVSLKSATLKLGDAVYTGDINTTRKTISFDVPESVATAANLASAQVSIATNSSSATVALSSPNLTSAITATISAPAGNSDTYTVRVEPSKIARTYDTEGATLNDNGMPDVLANEGGIKSSWGTNGGTTAPSVSLLTENGNQYINLMSKGNGYFGSVFAHGESVYGDKIISQVKFRLDNMKGMTNGNYYASMRAAHGELLTLKSLDVQAGTYTFGVKTIDDPATSGDMPNAPVLKAGEWYEIRFILRRYSETINSKDSYAVEIYINGNFVSEIQNYKSGLSEWHYNYLFRMSYVSSHLNNYPQFAVGFFSGFPKESSISLDDLYVSYMEDWSPTDSSVLYAPNCPVAIVNDASGNEVCYPVTLKTDEAVIDIPFTSVSDEYSAIMGTDWPEIHPDVTNAVILLPDNMKASLGTSASQSGAVVLNLNDTNTLNISTDGGSPVSYTVKTEYSENLAEASSSNAVTSSSPYTLSASGVPQNYSCKKMNTSADITFDTFADGDEAVISLYGADVAKIAYANGKIGFSGMSSEFSYSPELEIGDTVRFDCAIRDGNTAEVFADGIYMGSVSINSIDKLPSSDHFAVSCTGSAKLTLENISLSVINNLLDNKTVVHIIGDSLVQYYGNDVNGISRDIEGWGRYICDEFNDDTVVLNHARSGYNTNVYLNGTNRTNYETIERWSSVKSRMKNGDYLIISLAWNEENSVDGTKTEAAYKANMNKIISDAKALGVTPIVCTPPVSITHWTDTTTSIVKSRINNEKETWAQYVRDIAADNNIVCLDLNTALFEDVWKDAYRHDSSGSINNNQAGWDISNNIYETYSIDGLHVKRAGAQLYKDTLINLLKTSDSSLKSKLK